LKVGIQKSSIQWTGEVFLHEDRLIEPLHWKKPSLVFVNSMSDLFHENIPFEFIIKLFCTIEKSSHTFQILTKRQDRMLEFFTSTEDKEDQIGFDWPLPNVWIGVSCEDQKTANERIPVLLEIPAEVRFVSLEPLLGSIDLSEFIQTYTCYGCGYRGNNCDHSEDNEDNEITCPECGTEAGEGFGEAENDPQYTGIDWVIIGAESGCAARPMELDWARSILDQCKNADVPFFMKQLCNENGRKIPFEQWPGDLKIREYPLGNRIAG
jgi:protein gp37